MPGGVARGVDIGESRDAAELVDRDESAAWCSEGPRSRDRGSAEVRSRAATGIDSIGITSRRSGARRPGPGRCATGHRRPPATARHGMRRRGPNISSGRFSGVTHVELDVRADSSRRRPLSSAPARRAGAASAPDREVRTRSERPRRTRSRLSRALNSSMEPGMANVSAPGRIGSWDVPVATRRAS